MYSGSMFGKPAIYFAVWGWVISHQYPVRRLSKHLVEVNPSVLAATFSASTEEIIGVFKEMCLPDLNSRSRQHDGKKLIPEFEGEIICGPMTFCVVNGPKYRSILNEEERRCYLASKKAEERAAKSFVNKVNSGQHSSTQAEVEVESEELKVQVKPLAQSLLVQAEEIYKAYPRKIAHKKSVASICKSMKEIEPSELLSRVRVMAEMWVGSDMQYCPYPSTWFGQERWNDDPSTWKPQTIPGKPQPGKSLEERISNDATRHAFRVIDDFNKMQVLQSRAGNKI